MRITVIPSAVSGTLPANPYKSHAQRAIAMASLANGTSLLSGIGQSDDVLSALGVAKAMGAQVSRAGDTVKITGSGQLRSSIWDCGESGFCLRMYSAIAGLYDNDTTLTAHGTLLSRPMDFMADTFVQLGVAFRSNEGHAPLHIKGPYLHNSATLDGSISSQFLTGLLVALPRLKKNSTVEVKELKSSPYVDYTLQTLRDFGVHVYHESYSVFHINGSQQYRPVDLKIQGDWSGMACILVAAAIAGEVRVTGLPSADLQADGRILEVLRKCGAFVEAEDAQVCVRRENLQAFDFDATQCPDLFPPLVALAAHCSGASRIKGAHRLRSKESDRSSVLINEFVKLGVDIVLEDDALIVKGGVVSGATVAAHGDHRIAMALAAAALGAVNPVSISAAESVAKSYPDFFKDLELLGAHILYNTEDDE